MNLLIKLGGTLLDAPDHRRRLAREIVEAQAAGHRIVVVHGGGKQMTRFLDERGVESRFVNGLRVSTPETMDAVLKVLAGSVNKELVAALVAAGAKAVGLSGIDASLVEAEQMDPELGAVGRVVRVNSDLLNLLAANGYLPVIACVAGDRSGGFYNINGDQMAVACAATFAADKLLFLTDVPGVLGLSGSVMPVIDLHDMQSLVANGVAKGGMEAKLNAATSALNQGVGQVHIVPGAVDGVIGFVLSNRSIGTVASLGAGELLAGARQ